MLTEVTQGAEKAGMVLFRGKGGDFIFLSCIVILFYNVTIFSLLLLYIFSSYFGGWG